MTIPASARALGNRLPSADERAAATQLRKIVAATAGDENPRLRFIDPGTNKPAEITLSPSLSDLLIALLRPISAGDAITLVPVSQMLTTQQAADILNVSRPYLIGLLENGDMEHEMVGRHRRIKAEALFDYKRRRDEAREQALEEIADLDAQLL